MTNEELKEGRRLLAEYNAMCELTEENDGMYMQRTYAAEDFGKWAVDHGEALLAAAEQLAESTPNSAVEHIAIQRNLALAALGLKPNASVEEIRAKDAEIAELRKKYDVIGAQWLRLLKLVDEDEWKRLTDQLEAATNTPKYIHVHAVGSHWDMAYVRYLAEQGLRGKG